MPKGEGLAAGIMPPNSRQTAVVGGDTSYDSIPSYLYYVKAVQEGNSEAAQQALSHIAKVRGGRTAADIALMGQRLSKTNLNELAKRSVASEGNPQLRQFYAMVNENPNLLNHFDMQLPKQVGIANSLTGMR